MASDNPFQRSVHLLGEAVGSPTLHQSPRHVRHRSSLFSGSVFPLRHSDVREFALNTSITMSTSELENYYVDTSVVTTPTPTGPLVREVSDNLFQSFLECMQSHASAREVFDAVGEFVQACNNTLDIMKETHSDKELEWLELERNTWRLVLCLYQNRLATADVERADRDEDMIVDLIRPPSEKEIVENFYKTNPKINEYQLVVDWLEKSAADIADGRQAPKLHHFMDNTVAWENTLHELQNETIAYRSSRAIVTKLDPDAPLRESKPLHDLDMEDEARLLKQVFNELRCGRTEKAQAICHHCGQPWRAASLEGWRLYHDPNYSTRPQPQLATTEKLPIEGNPNRDIWKLCAWRLSENERAGTYARAVHGALCGHLPALLLACHSWDDVLWAHTRVLVDQLVEREIRNNSLREYVPLADAYWDCKLSMEDTFTTLDGNADPIIRQQARCRERVVQKMLILDQLPQLMCDMLEWARKDDCNSHMLRFLAHLVLVLRQLGQQASQDVGDEIIKLYVQVLMQQEEASLVAYYTATLLADDQVALYAQFLQNITDSTQRKAALDAAATVQLPIEAITQRVVENIRNEKGQDHGVSLQLSGEVTDEDRRKISALEWVVLYPSQRAEAIWQTNALIRTFFASEKIQAARLAFNQIPPESIDQVLSQFQGEDDSASVYSDCMPPRVSAAIQEYLSHKAYLDAQEGFADWFEHYHHARPKEPPAPSPTSSFTDKVAYDHRMAAYRKELDRWRVSMDHQTKCVKQQLYNVLLFPNGGWLADTDHEDRLRQLQMETLRNHCIPKIVLLLHTVVHSMGLYKEAIQLANLVIEEQHHLYKVYTKSQLGELLSKVRESSLASLAQSKDPWGHPVAS